MPVGIYTDVHIPKPIVIGLKLRGVNVLTAQDDEMGRAADAEILDRAAELNRIVFTHDDDFLKEVSARIKGGRNFAGVVFAHQLNAPIGRCIDDLELIAKSFEIDDLKNKVEFIPY